MLDQLPITSSEKDKNKGDATHCSVELRCVPFVFLLLAEIGELQQLGVFRARERTDLDRPQRLQRALQVALGRDGAESDGDLVTGRSPDVVSGRHDALVSGREDQVLAALARVGTGQS